METALIHLPFTIYHLRLLYFSIQPGFRHAPLSFDGGGADAENFSRLFHRKTAKESQLDKSAFLRIDLGEALERLVQRDEFVGSFSGHIDVLVEREFLKFAAALVGLLSACVVNEYAPHHLCGNTEKVRAILPVRLRLIDHAQVSLVYERGRLQRVSLTLPAQIARREPSEFCVDEWQ